MNIRQLPTEPGASPIYEVESQTTPGLWYGCVLVTAGVGYCACPDFARHNDTAYQCKHLSALAAHIRAKAQRAQIALVPEDRAAAETRLREIAATFDI